MLATLLSLPDMTKFTNQNASAPGWALCFMLLLWAPVVASAQVARQPLPAPVQKLINNLESNHDRDAQPAIWLHTDQPYYLNTDTIRLNVFVYNKVARNTRYNGQLWVDLVDRDNVIRRNLLLSVQGGRAYCTLPLGADLADDYYMLTAYTREMTGCGTDCFYQQPLLVLPPWSEAETEKEQLFIDAGSSTIEVKALPVTGQLVAGIETDVYIRARRGFREGVALTGILETAAGDTITDFKLDQLGLGQVAFVPRAGESYHLRIDPRWDISQRIPLRAVSSTGIQVQVKNLIGQGVNVKVERTEDYEPTDDLYLLVQAAGQLVYEGRVDLSRNNVFQTRIDQGDFPIAMAEAVLLTAGGQVLQKQLFYPLEPTVLRMRPLLDGKGQSQPREEVVMEGVLQWQPGGNGLGQQAIGSFLWPFPPFAGPLFGRTDGA